MRAVPTNLPSGKSVLSQLAIMVRQNLKCFSIGTISSESYQTKAPQPEAPMRKLGITTEILIFQRLQIKSVRIGTI